MSGHLEKFEKSLSEKYSRNVVIVCQDMPNKYVALAVHVAAKGMNRELPMEKIVGRIVEACTRAKGHSHWNCIAAPRFGFDVAYAEEYMLQFKIDNQSFLLFRTKEKCGNGEED
ncbi:Dynein light chain [Trichinella sp. T8]|nr:Dynein light chain [Trichinella sp. T8]